MVVSVVRTTRVVQEISMLTLPSTNASYEPAPYGRVMIGTLVPNLPPFNRELSPSPVIHLTSLDPGQAELGYIVGTGGACMIESYAQTGLKLTLIRSSDSSYSSTSSSSKYTTGIPDNVCPPPPLACVTMDPQGQAMLNKKLRKMGGWKVRLFNVPPSTRANSPRRSAIRRALNFLDADIVFRRS